MTFRVSEWILYLALLSYAIGFIVYPMLIIVIESFRDPLNGSLSLNNYYKFFTDRYYFDCLINSVITALLTVLIATVLGLPLAYI
ncbi:MAG: hypothetical protein QXM43_08925, partial [Desulfurococcaceae archaeon]